MSAKNTKRASQDALDDLHGALAVALKQKIADGTATAADLNVARQFLKDNGIDSIPTKDNPLGGLLQSLPFADPSAIAEEDDLKH